MDVHVLLLEAFAWGDMDVSGHLVDLNVPVQATSLSGRPLQLFGESLPLTLDSQMNDNVTLSWLLSRKRMFFC